MAEQSALDNLDNALDVFPKTYDPCGTESRWQKIWEEEGAFHPDPQDGGESFSIVIPPPNVTGSLHMGHAFNTALIDAIVRFQRLQGKNVLCLPGTDHASIAVQTILEKQLKQEGLSRKDLGREGFLERAWAWKLESGGRIVKQLRRLGYSVDWKRERFTMDARLSQAVSEAFLRLHKQGLIYRGEYLVNWCPASGSAVSDLEVEMKEVDGHLWHFRYPLTSASEQNIKYLEVATTRPETMMGDVAVAVNPSDKRYQHLVGQTLTLPFIGRQIPIIADDHVDQEFGTGCVKVTPAHDPNDFEIGRRHNLPQITVMNKDGTMNVNAGRFHGLDRFEARHAVVEALKEEGLLTKVEAYQHSVPFSDRGKVPVEPLLSTQWFVRMEPMANRCRDYLVKGQPRFVPNRWNKVYKDWLTDIRDWCISRQLWWGHRIPAWFVVSETNNEVTKDTPYIVALSEEAALVEAQNQYGNDATIEQDEDVLDTWFSSGLWPFSTLGWPNSDLDFSRWYPTNTLVTGFDIIFFWVARMTMMATNFTGYMPFADVYIHGLVRDEQNRKMSKSAGNGIDPLLLIDRYGTDALRFALVKEVVGAGQDIRLDYDRRTETSATVETARNFANKLWNATRFALLNLGDTSRKEISVEIDSVDLELSDRWILSRLSKLNIETVKKYTSYGLGEAAKGLYEFAWNDFCDWYLELIKRRLNVGDQPTDIDLKNRKISLIVMFKVLREFFVMMHPLMPHLTEELWHGITGQSDQQLLALQSWPVANPKFINEDLESSFSELFASIRLIRNLRAEAGLKPSQNAPVCLVTKNQNLLQILKLAIPDIQSLTKASTVDVVNHKEISDKTNAKSLVGVSGELEVILSIGGLIDVIALKDRLNRDLLKAEKEIQTLSGRLNNASFIKKAPEKVVLDCRTKLSDAQSQEKLVRNRLNSLE